MPTSFENKKILKFVITLATGSFGSAEKNQVTLEGYRSSVEISKAGGMENSYLRAKIYGVSQSDMNSTVTLRWKMQTISRNTIEVYAIDGPKQTKVFGGNLVNAWGMYQSMPDVYLMIHAQSTYYQQVSPAPPRSFSGSVDVASIMSQISDSMGLKFENNGVDVQIQDPYLGNTNLEQAKELARIAGIDMYHDDEVLAICPRGVERNGTMPLISKETGLIGYPTFDSVGVNFECLFNPSVVFGGKVKLSTEIKQADGEWVASSISHHLDSMTPGGRWFSRIRGIKSGLVIPK